MVTDTTTRLLQLWKRFPETRVERLGHNEYGWTLNLSDSDDVRAYIPDSLAHAIAGWRLLELLMKGKSFPRFWFTSNDAPAVKIRHGVECRTYTGEGTLDALISAYWASKGEQEPSP